MAPNRRTRTAALALAVGLVVAACSTDDDGGAGDAAPEGTAAPDVASYEPPAQHASDWGAPDEPLPDAPRPYGPSPEPTADPAFYDVRTLDAVEVAAAEPGDVLRSEPAELTGPLDGATGWRVLYRSTDAEGEPAVVSGIVLVPEGTAPEGGRPVVAWAHGTTGIADRCAPSTRGDLFYEDYGQVGRELLDQGFVVAATDYHGLGTPGVHSYHHSGELATATIDSVVAAHDLEDVGELSPSWATIGHSEGGLAVLAVDERAEDHPADLEYLGSVAAAPSADLAAVAPAIFGVAERGYGIFLLEAWAEVAPELDPSVALGPEAAARSPLWTHGCWEEAVPGFDDIRPEEMLTDLAVAERLAEVLDEQASHDPSAIVGPLLVVQGADDGSVPEPLTAALVDELCAEGVAVEYEVYEGIGHDPVMAAAAADIAEWFAARLAGQEPGTTCDGA